MSGKFPFLSFVVLFSGFSCSVLSGGFFSLSLLAFYSTRRRGIDVVD
jgi:hypothetical protein